MLLTGIGLRDPWPADEPRFAAIARDMLINGNWHVPSIGGAIYADKPPLYFWLLAASFWLMGSVRSGFLLPVACAGLVTLAATADLARRLFSREAALWTGIVLLTTFRFSLEYKSAQIDPVVMMFTTLGLYGLLRHLLLGPDWRWYAIGGFACGLGIITKGVGFLPLLVLLPYAVLTRRGWPGGRVRGSDPRWLIAPAALLLGAAVWLGPLLSGLASDPSPQLHSYLEEILFGQTVGRYLDATGHLRPWWYVVVAVIPWAWLPVTLTLPWLYRHWREAIGRRDLKIGLLLSWIGLVVLFFSLSSGKRGVYILPAVPALALATGPYVSALLEKRTLQRLAWALLAVATLAFGAGAARRHRSRRILRRPMGDLRHLRLATGQRIPLGPRHHGSRLRAKFHEPCFDYKNAIPLGYAHGTEWLLVPSKDARPSCAANGRTADAIAYHAPLAARLR